MLYIYDIYNKYYKLKFAIISYDYYQLNNTKFNSV